MDNLRVIIIVLAACYFVFRFLKRKKRSASISFDELEGGLTDKRKRATRWTDSRAGITTAVQAGDKDTINAILENASSVEEKDELYKIVIGQTYYQRKEGNYADLCEAFGLAYVDFFNESFPKLSQRKGYSLYNLGFKYLAIVLAERRKYDQAVVVCQKALSYNLTDKTKTGYEGRLQRINKQRSQV